MTAFYDGLQATADRLLLDKGQPCTLGVVTAGAYDPATGTSTPTTTSYPVTGFRKKGYPLSFIDGTMIQRGDRRYLISALGLTVKFEPGFTFTDSTGAVFSIIDAEDLSPAATDLLWEIQVRR